MIKFVFLVLPLFIFSFSVVRAQQHLGIIDSLTQRINRYGVAKTPGALFVHFDKTIYGNGEHAWFSGYLLINDTDISAHNILSVALIRNDDRSIWAEDKFVMKNGIASGNLFFPDTIPPGNYNLVAYTNVIKGGYPEEIFSQQITVKTNEADFEVNLVLTDSVITVKDTAHMKVKVTSGSLNISKARVSYILERGMQASMPQKLKTNKYGEAFINIPLRHIIPGNNTLHVQVKNGFLFKDISLKLPVYRREARVKFYPEGGNLIDKTPCYVGWEVVNSEGEPLQVSGLLYENGKMIDTIETNGYGMGKFIITPLKNNNYSVKILYTYSKDTIYALPRTIEAMPVISIVNGVTADTLQLILRNMNTLRRDLFLLIHDYRQVFLHTLLRINRHLTKP